ncbi:MAG: Fic family protein [Planctomycetes bacterium]|nr:Fic family protein [Planctomycetota bacterium]MCB9869060.1 Fic family protein [Planctomycetota bacterium]MCB9888018.1 Fic family protein [Planctomycetota bacterium]
MADADPLGWNALQLLDLELAHRFSGVPTDAKVLVAGAGIPEIPRAEPCAFVAAVLGLRGLPVAAGDVASVIRGSGGAAHERALISGMHRVYECAVDWGAGGRAPDGWLMASLFKQLTRDVPRFRNNHLRRDAPWDSVLYVKYPDAGVLPERLDRFNRDVCYGDHPLRFNHLHPARQAFRVLWHFARIAPFPDFNLSMAWVAMNIYLLHAGYPMLTPEAPDREALHRMVTGPVPLSVPEMETRLLNALDG